MSDWFLISVWYENGETEVHFEVANEEGEQYFFNLTAQLINERLVAKGETALDKFYYAEENMLALAVTIIDEEMVEEGREVHVNLRLFNHYFNY